MTTRHGADQEEQKQGAVASEGTREQNTNPLFSGHVEDKLVGTTT